VSADRVHPRDLLRNAAPPGRIDPEPRDRTTPSERASAAIRAGADRARAHTALPDDDAGTGK
jgi:hypothetical protein